MGRLHDWSDVARAINAQMAVAAVDADSVFAADDCWDFFCECGRPDCGTRVILSLADYTALREAAGGAVVADGHHVIRRARAARRLAVEARAEAAALKAQAEQIRRRYGL